MASRPPRPIDFGAVFGIAPEVSADAFGGLGAHVNQAMARLQAGQVTHPPQQSWLDTASADQIERATAKLRQQNLDAVASILDAKARSRR